MGEYCRFADKGMLVHRGNRMGRRPNLPFRRRKREPRPAYTKYLTTEPHGPLHMGPLDVFLRVSFAGFAGILATVSVQSYARHRERRLLLLTSAFAIFLVQGIWLFLDIGTLSVFYVGCGWL